MKTNMELIKQILLAINEKFNGTDLLSQLSLGISKYSSQETFFHTEALFKSGYISRFDSSWNEQQGHFFLVSGLTCRGKDLVNLVMDTDKWEATKDEIKAKDFPYILVQNLRFYFPPNIDGPLWRYMKLDKLESILSTDSLYFCRADLLGDPFEGSAPKPTIEYRTKFYKGATQHYLEEGIPKELDVNRKTTYISCWHNNPIESALMWRTYGTENKTIAIRTTIKKLEDSILSENKEFILSPINYIDYDNDFFPEGNLFTHFTHKQKQYEGEKEFRVITSDCEMIFGNIGAQPKGLFINIDKETLIHSIIISPYSTCAFKSEVIEILKKYGFDHRIVESGISCSPKF